MQSSISTNLSQVLIERASFWRRLAAYWIDTIVTSIPLFLFVVVPPLRFILQYRDIYGFIMIFLYYALLQYFRGGQTIGKIACHIKVVDTSGNNLSLPHLLIRELFSKGPAYLLFWLFYGQGFYAWYLTYLFALGPQRLALHDIVMKTQVINTAPAANTQFAEVILPQAIANDITYLKSYLEGEEITYFIQYESTKEESYPRILVKIEDLDKVNNFIKYMELCNLQKKDE